MGPVFVMHFLAILVTENFIAQMKNMNTEFQIPFAITVTRNGHREMWKRHFYAIHSPFSTSNFLKPFHKLSSGPHIGNPFNLNDKIYTTCISYSEAMVQFPNRGMLPQFTSIVFPHSYSFSS